MKPVVYIIESLVNHSYYIGSTTDLTRRLHEHNIGKTKYTKNLRPFIIVFQQEYDTIVEARKIEYKLKRLKSRKIIEKIIKDRVIKLES